RRLVPGQRGRRRALTGARWRGRSWRAHRVLGVRPERRRAPDGGGTGRVGVARTGSSIGQAMTSAGRARLFRALLTPQVIVAALLLVAAVALLLGVDVLEPREPPTVDLVTTEETLTAVD